MLSLRSPATRRLSSVAALLALGALAGPSAAPLVAQQVPIVLLGAPTGRSADPFTLVGGIREVAPGKILVVDPRDRTALLIDLVAGTRTKVGREGSGPGEYRYPNALLPLPNHETLLADPPQTRFLRIDATGKVVETIGYPPGIGSAMRPHGVDAQGRVYFEGASVSGRPDVGIVTADSVPVIRWDRKTGRIDSLMMVKGVPMRVSVSGEGTARNFSVRQQPYGSRDGWAVGADGRVAVARSTPYRVDTRGPSGARTIGPVVLLQAQPVTPADREAFLQGIRSERRTMQASGDGGGSGGGRAAPPGPQPPPPSADDFDWPATKPYFDAASVQMSPTGELWSERTRAAGDEIPVYDVFGADGRLVRRVSFPAKTRLVGFGDGTIYTARTDEDDLQYLERYRDCGVSGCDSRGVRVGE